MYAIIHWFNVDGGYGDAIYNESVIGLVKTEEEAQAYINKWENPEVYDRPYAELWHKGMRYQKIGLLDMNEDPFGDGANSDCPRYNYDSDDFKFKEDK